MYFIEGNGRHDIFTLQLVSDYIENMGIDNNSGMLLKYKVDSISEIKWLANNLIEVEFDYVIDGESEIQRKKKAKIYLLDLIGFIYNRLLY